MNNVMEAKKAAEANLHDDVLDGILANLALK